MGDELEFRTAVGGYRKDDVLEYVENVNDMLFQMTRDHENETKEYQNRISELEDQLRQAEEKQTALGEENRRLQEALAHAEEMEKDARQDYQDAEEYKNMLKEKLAREILRLRENNKVLQEKLEKAEKKIEERIDYKGVSGAVSEVQYKITEYVNILNKTQQQMEAAYRDMNTLKEQISQKIEEEKEENKKAAALQNLDIKEVLQGGCLRSGLFRRENKLIPGFWILQHFLIFLPSGGHVFLLRQSFQRL